MQAVYVDQLAEGNREKVEKVNGLINDKQAAKRFGARNLKEYSYWAWRACGVANVAMIFQSENLWEGKLMELVLEGLKMNGYAYKNIRGEKDVGWRHQCLMKMMEERGLQSKRREGVKAKELKNEIDGSYVIASIKSKPGSHLVLLKEFVKGTWIVNDPYGFDRQGEDRKIGEEEFKKVFLGKVIMVSYG